MVTSPHMDGRDSAVLQRAHSTLAPACRLQRFHPAMNSMQRYPYLRALVAAAALMGCTDPPFPDEPGVGGKPDDPTTPGKPAPGAKNDAKVGGGSCQTTSSGWTCPEIGECAGKCGINLGCIDACTAKGCAAGKTGFDNLSGCVKAKCIGQCLGGFTTSCDDCQKKLCVPENNACGATTCAVTTCPPAAADGGPAQPPADGGAFTAPTTPAPGTTCYDLMECATKCGSLYGCVDDCRGKACKSAKIIFDKLAACAVGTCGFDCLIGYNSYCRTCLMTKCPADWKACETDAC